MTIWPNISEERLDYVHFDLKMMKTDYNTSKNNYIHDTQQANTPRTVEYQQKSLHGLLNQAFQGGNAQQYPRLIQ